MHTVTKVLLALLAASAVIANPILNDIDFDLAKDESIPEHKDQLTEAIEKYHFALKDEMKLQQEKNAEMLKSVLGSTMYVCTGGKAPSSMTKREYVKAFNNGPCSPVAVLAGITGTKLFVRIDCETFKANHPYEFSKCFSTCSGFYAPKKEYRVWVPHITDPMSILKPSDSSRDCFDALMGHDLSVLVSSGKAQSRKGLTIYPMGLSPETSTKATSDCGMDSIINLFPTMIQFGGYSQYRDLYTVLKNAGYVSGLNVQALPYDWRLSYKESQINNLFPKVIKRLYDNSAKKVSIIAHSFGNLQVIHNLWKMSQADKDKYIARYFALAPPYLGTSQILSGIIGFDDRYTFHLKVADLGITPKMYKASVADLKGMFSLMNKRSIGQNYYSSWWKAIQGRIEAERLGVNQASGTIMDIFPPVTATCAPYFSTRAANCKLNLNNIDAIGTVNGEQITSSNVCQIIGKYGVGYAGEKFCQENADANFDQLTNTGVQTNILFSSTVLTKFYFDFKSDPRIKTRELKPADQTWTYTYGDGSVNTGSAVIAGIKWAEDFKNKVYGAKPVTFIEACSSYNERKSIFKAGKNWVENNEYIGIGCQCKGSSWLHSNGDGCGHVGLVSDSYTIELLLNSIIDWQAPKTTYERTNFESNTSEWITSYENECRMLNW